MSSFKRHPIASFKAWRLELFDEAARQDLIPDPSDILVETRGSAIRPLNQRLAEDMWDINSCIENKTKLPRTILKNGKRSKVDLDKSRRAPVRDLASSNHPPRNPNFLPSTPPLSLEQLTQVYHHLQLYIRKVV